MSQKLKWSSHLGPYLLPDPRRLLQWYFNTVSPCPNCCGIFSTRLLNLVCDADLVWNRPIVTSFTQSYRLSCHFYVTSHLFGFSFGSIFHRWRCKVIWFNLNYQKSENCFFYWNEAIPSKWQTRTSRNRMNWRLRLRRVAKHFLVVFDVMYEWNENQTFISLLQICNYYFRLLLEY